MKHYRITVNGTSYDVTVEELGASKYAPATSGASAPTSTAPSVAGPVTAPEAAPQPAPAQPTAAQSAAAPANGGSVTTVKSPMPGTVVAFKVIVGQKVKRGDVLLLLEAMKMENEIVAPQDGTVVALRVAASAAVNTGDPLVDLA
ncbi:MAG: biotin/lipoyl-containing protein [Rectinema sp.]